MKLESTAWALAVAALVCVFSGCREKQEPTAEPAPGASVAASSKNQLDFAIPITLEKGRGKIQGGSVGSSPPPPPPPPPQ